MHLLHSASFPKNLMLDDTKHSDLKNVCPYLPAADLVHFLNQPCHMYFELFGNNFPSDLALSARFHSPQESPSYRRTPVLYYLYPAINNLLHFEVLSLLIFWYYHHIAMKYFGGTTGDISGFFLCICEVGMALILAVVSNF